MSSVPTQPLVNNVVVHKIEVPRKTPYNPHDALALIEQLAGSYNGNLAFRLSSESGKVTFELIDYQANGTRASIAVPIRSVMGPNAEIETRPFLPTLYNNRIRYHLLAPLFHPSMYEGNWFLSSVHLAEAPEDPLAYIAHAMGEAQTNGVTVNLTYILASTTFTNQKGVEDARRKILGLPSDTEKLVRGLINVTGFFAYGIFKTGMEELGGDKSKWTYKGIVPFSPQALPPDEMQRRLLAKANSPHLYQLYLILEAYGEDELSVHDVSNNITGHLLDRYRGEVAGIGVPTQPIIGEIKVREVRDQTQLDKHSLPAYLKFLNENEEIRAKTRCVLTSDELAALWHLPHEGMAAEYVTFLMGGKPSRDLIANSVGNVIGKNGTHDIFLPNTGDPRHTNIIGKSGAGKSTLIHNLIHHEIAQGKGVGIIDPHGNLVRDILRASIPDTRINDVVVIDLADEINPPPLNPLLLADEKEKIAVGQVLAILDKIYDLKNLSRSYNALKAALHSLNFVANPTIRDVIRLFDNAEARQDLLHRYGRLLPPVSQQFWHRYNVMSIDKQDDITYPVVHRLQGFYDNPLLYPIMCNPNSLDWGKLMSENKIILISLAVDEAKVGPSERQLIGTLLVSQMEIAARRCGQVHPLDFHLYIDEAQKFVTTTMDTMFTEMRKYGVWLTIANQYLDQLKGPILNAVMGTVTTTIAFEVGGDDAKELAKYFQPNITPDDLLHLGKYRAAVRTTFNRHAESPFVIDTGPSPSIPDIQRAQARELLVRQASLKNYPRMNRDDVLRWLEERYPYEDFGYAKEGEEEDTDSSSYWETC